MSGYQYNYNQRPQDRRDQSSGYHIRKMIECIDSAMKQGETSQVFLAPNEESVMSDILASLKQTSTSLSTKFSTQIKASNRSGKLPEDIIDEDTD